MVHLPDLIYLYVQVLHNLARLLLTLQYLDDALFLARRSLELQAPDRNAWQQHFTLGEILKAYGHHQEAALHFKVKFWLIKTMF